MSDNEIYEVTPAGDTPFKDVPSEGPPPDWVSDNLRPYRWWHYWRDCFLCWWRRI